MDGFGAHSFGDLIAEFGTLCRNEVRVGGGEHTFARLTKPTMLQTRGFELPGVKLHAQPKPGQLGSPEFKR